MDMVEVYKKRTYRDKREYNLLYETLKDNVLRNETKLLTAIDMVTQMNDVVSTLTEVGRIDVSLERQDEIDRQATQLYGMNAAKNAA